MGDHVLRHGRKLGTGNETASDGFGKLVDNIGDVVSSGRNRSVHIFFGVRRYPARRRRKVFDIENDAFRTEFANAQKTIGDDVAAPRPFAERLNRLVVDIDK